MAKSCNTSSVVGDDLPLGKSGATISWKQFQAASGWARQLRYEMVELERAHNSLSEREDWRKQRGILREYQEYLVYSSATSDLSGQILPDPRLVKSCFEKGLIGVDPHIVMGVMPAIRDCSQSPSPTLIRGETGTGKEIVAKCIHDLSDRCGEFIPINCAGIPEGLLESELLGYKQGAFTGAKRDTPGKFRLADKGTIFLDEIGDMPVSLQAKVLRVLNDHCVTPLGAKKAEEVDVRVIAATHVDLDAQMQEKRFRQDLYYRLNTMEINLRPLYLRPGDLPLLIYYFVKMYKEHGSAIKFVTQGLLEEAMLYRWKGNGRELRSLVERACNVARNQSKNSDTLGGLDVLHDIRMTRLVPGVVGAGADKRPGVDLGRKVDIETLPEFNVRKFMDERDKVLIGEDRRLWTLTYRLGVLLDERLGGPSFGSAEPANDPPSTNLASVYDRPFDYVQRDYAQWMIAQYRNANAASKMAGLDAKTLTKWAKRKD